MPWAQRLSRMMAGDREPRAQHVGCGLSCRRPCLRHLRARFFLKCSNVTDYVDAFVMTPRAANRKCVCQICSAVLD
jgi:hypothetical protein